MNYLLVAFVLAAGCAAPSRAIRLEADDSYCSRRDDGGELCISGVRAGLDSALQKALESARLENLSGRVQLVGVSVHERDAEAGLVELRYRIELRDSAPREETLTRPYDDGRAPIREAVLRLLVELVSRTVAQAGSPISL